QHHVRPGSPATPWRDHKSIMVETPETRWERSRSATRFAPLASLRRVASTKHIYLVVQLEAEPASHHTVLALHTDALQGWCVRRSTGLCRQGKYSNEARRAAIPQVQNERPEP